MTTMFGPPHCVLVVEDDLIIATDIDYMLRERGVSEVILASSVAEALKFVVATRVDAAILDYRVRKEVTTELANQLLNLSIPFIFATGFALNATMPKQLSQIPIVLKPFHADNMMSALYQAMERRDQRLAV